MSVSPRVQNGGEDGEENPEGLVEFYGGPWDGETKSLPLNAPDWLMQQTNSEGPIVHCLYRDTGMTKMLGRMKPIRIFRAALGGNFAGPPPLPRREA